MKPIHAIIPDRALWGVGNVGDPSRSPLNLLRPTLDMTTTGMDLFPIGYRPGRFDVICARGKEALKHTGNQRYRHLIDLYLEAYKDASNRQEKSRIVSSVVDSVRAASPDGGFVRQDEATGRWYEVGDHFAREKTGQV